MKEYNGIVIQFIVNHGGRKSLVGTRSFNTDISLPGRDADLRPLPLMDSMCPLWIMCGAD
ncbi:MAG: hypothetical protein A2Z29_09040 [Chloroflexi bacterium RBG_16_56_11]|nr:MAG: hypothetical protein A2Z29_09040 [Chloroflexi bacterium RBG_16_56_11]